MCPHSLEQGVRGQGVVRERQPGKGGQKRGRGVTGGLGEVLPPGVVRVVLTGSMPPPTGHTGVCVGLEQGASEALGPESGLVLVNNTLQLDDSTSNKENMATAFNICE